MNKFGGLIEGRGAEIAGLLQLEGRKVGETKAPKEERAGHYTETVVGGRILQGRWNDVFGVGT